MILEFEHAIVRPLEDVFNRTSVQNLKDCGVNGVIPIEVSFDELMTLAENKGYKTGGIRAELIPEHLGMIWVQTEEDGESPVVFYTRKKAEREEVYVLDCELERFKELFLGKGAVG